VASCCTRWVGGLILHRAGEPRGISVVYLVWLVRDLPALPSSCSRKGAFRTGERIPFRRPPPRRRPRRPATNASWSMAIVFDWIADQADVLGDLPAAAINRENARVARIVA
jgi:hypothetical protein